MLKMVGKIYRRASRCRHVDECLSFRGRRDAKLGSE